MATWHYQLADSDMEEDNSPYIAVCHMYCFDHLNFTEDDWTLLYEIYRNLPGDFVDGPDTWFHGDEEKEIPPYLYASMEPPGLQICGELTEEMWTDRHDQQAVVATGKGAGHGAARVGAESVAHPPFAAFGLYEIPTDLASEANKLRQGRLHVVVIHDPKTGRNCAPAAPAASMCNPTQKTCPRTMAP